MPVHLQPMLDQVIGYRLLGRHEHIAVALQPERGISADDVVGRSQLLRAEPPGFLDLLVAGARDGGGVGQGGAADHQAARGEWPVLGRVDRDLEKT